jgi:hypothetical protein
MVVLHCLLRLSGLRLRVLGLDGRDDLRKSCKAFHAFELLLENEYTAAESVLPIASSALLLTNRLQKVLAFLREGLSNKEIAAQLSLSKYTGQRLSKAYCEKNELYVAYCRYDRAFVGIAE